ncbi:CBS domain-containing protein [Persephonella atlantica]|uniref:CBS domain-containing protein n=1 Tax=Persephonella atlantica TaxID=2699429 RepID=A0ABS1GI49_9AQUI|nr:CBS domain-containing protein [Persephonella atlantica]MBK3332511.1 CBS domain-containing protein [Persephonella atlantica]
MIVKDIMQKDVLMISPFASLKDAIKKMKESGVKALIVEKQHQNDTYGIITYTSILKAIYQEEGDIELLNVYDVAVKPALYISPNVEIKYAARMMINFNVKRLLVLENDNLIGIISMTDIIESIFIRN